MAAFEYQALDNKGKTRKGVLEADSARQVRQQLRDKGWMPLAVDASTEKQNGKSGFSFFTSGPSLNVQDLALITRQLATLIAAGLPIDEALRAVSEQNEKQKIKSMILSIRSKVLEGHTLADALKEFPRAFPHLYRSTVSAGEHAGHLDGVLNRLADYTEAQQEAATNIKLAAMYPIILTIVAGAIVVGLLTFVVPDIVEVFVRNGQELPWLTQLMLDISNGIKSYGLYILIAMALGLVAFFSGIAQRIFPLSISPVFTACSRYQWIRKKCQYCPLHKHIGDTNKLRRSFGRSYAYCLSGCREFTHTGCC